MAIKHVANFARVVPVRSVDVTEKVIFFTLEQLNTPIALGMWLRWKYKTIEKCRVHPSQLKPQTAKADWCAMNFYQKLNIANPTAKAACFASWLESEKACRDTNYLFKLRAQGNFSFPAETERALLHCSEKIALWLGNYNPAKHASYCKHGSRSDTALPYRSANLVNKWQKDAKSSSSCANFVLAKMPKGPDYYSTIFSERKESANYSQVPKTYYTERPITIENRWNMYYQLGLGYYMENKMKRSLGFTLATQPDVNRRLVRRAQLDGLATVDFESASDRIAIGLVEEVFPVEWLTVMHALRSSRIDFGKVLTLSKFSGMGNGFTFPMQTLIFWGLASYFSKTVSVFGDDVILESEAYDSFCRVCTHLGLKVNTAKSFSHGPFFESCGVDVYDGEEISPIRIRKVLDNVADTMQMAKRLFEYFSRYDSDRRTVGRLVRFRDELRSLQPRHLRFIGPPEALAFPGYPGECKSHVIHPSFDARRYKSLGPVMKQMKNVCPHSRLLAYFSNNLVGDKVYYPDPVGYRITSVVAIWPG